MNLSIIRESRVQVLRVLRASVIADAKNAAEDSLGGEIQQEDGSDRGCGRDFLCRRGALGVEGVCEG